MQRVMSAGNLPPTKRDNRLLLRANSTKRANDYYKDATHDADVKLVDKAQSPPIVTGTVIADASLPLKVGQAVLVTKAGEWISQLAAVKKIHGDNTYDVTVYRKLFSKFDKLKEDYVLTKKPYPSEVKEAPPHMAAALEASASRPPDFFDRYKVRVVRSKADGGGEEWGEVEINGPGFKWEETVRRREPTTVEWWLSKHPNSLTERVPGAEERNQQKLTAKIQQATGWRNVEQIYCCGGKLETWHLFRVHGIMEAGGALVVLGEGEEYDAERWAPLAVPARREQECFCTIS